MYQEITPDLATRCLELEAKWYRDNLTDADAEELSDERRSMQYAFRHYDALDLRGGAILVGDQIVAFTFGAPINHQTFGVHVEKADVVLQKIKEQIGEDDAEIAACNIKLKLLMMRKPK